MKTSCKAILIGVFLLLFANGIQAQTVKDIDGNVYMTVTIGKQVWMAENLKTTKYCNGDLIGTTAPADKDISGENTPKYQWASGGRKSKVATYGRLYTGYSISDSRNVCPTGWHVPTNEEWHTLILTLDEGAVYENLVLDYSEDESRIAGGKLKEKGNKHWLGPNRGATNETGFTALPSGERDSNGRFEFKMSSNWWSASKIDEAKAYTRSVGTGIAGVIRSFDDKGDGYSVRCVKDIIGN